MSEVTKQKRASTSPWSEVIVDSSP